MKRILETESMETFEEAVELDKMTQKYIYILDEAMARSALRMGIAKGLVLEVGIGTAGIAAKLIKYNPHFSVIGLDLSPNMLKIAKKNTKEAKIKADKITLMKADAKRLPFKTESFDLVISHNMLHHLPDPVPMLEEIKRVAKQKGAILIRDVVRPSNKFLAKIYTCLFGLKYTKKMHQMYYDSMLAAFSVKEVKDILEKIGVNDANITTHFLTHFGIEKKSPLGETVEFEPQRLDLFREISLCFYK